MELPRTSEEENEGEEEEEEGRVSQLPYCWNCSCGRNWIISLQEALMYAAILYQSFIP